MPATSTAVRVSASDLAPATDQSATRTTKQERRRVTGRVKLACDAMVWEGLDWQAAAAKANLHVRSMRLALERPHVKQYLAEQKQVFRASASAQNISRLVDIRDQSDNKMASLGAIKLLEEGSDPGGNDAPVRTPGISIQIINQVHTDAKPLELHGPVGKRRNQQESEG